ncbi:MAG: AsmA family protein [Magnetococcales bacterium]|nr:AsmA family protein [Magnetococcales bacterium]
MGTILKTVLFLLLAMVILGLGAVVIVPLVVDPNDYKPALIQAVKDRTGRDLTIGGEVGLSLFPWVGVKLERVTLSNAPLFSDRPMAQVKRLDIRVKLLPLLDRRVEVNRVVVEGLQLDLERDRAGRGNWVGLTGAAAPAPAAATPPATAPEPGSGEEGAGLALAAVTVGGVEITDGAVRFADQATGDQVAVERFNLATGPVAHGQPVAIDSSLEWRNAQPKTTGTLQLAGTLHGDQKSRNFRLAGTRLALRAAGEGLPDQGVEATLAAEIATSLDDQTLTVTGLTLGVVDHLQLTGRIDGREILGDPRFDAQLALARFDPRRLLERLGQPVPADLQAFGAVALETTLGIGLDRAEVQKLAMDLDGAHLTGTAVVTRFAKPTIRFDLNLDHLDLDRYLLPPQTGAAGPAPGEPSPAPGAARPAPAAARPLAALAGLDLEGRLRLGRLTAHGGQFTNLQARVRARDGLLRLDPFQASLYEGTLEATAQLDLRGAAPALALKPDFRGVKIQPLLKEMLDMDLVSGTATLGMDLTSRGLDAATLRSNLDGSARFDVADGAVFGVDLERRILEAYALLKQRPLTLREDQGKTVFKTLSGSATIRQGVVDNRDLVAASGLLEVEGGGQVDLPGETLDYLLKAKVLPALEEIDHTARDLKGLEIPVRVTGGFGKPEVQVDLAELLESAAKTQAKEKLLEKLQTGKTGEKVKKLEEKLGIPLKDILPF